MVLQENQLSELGNRQQTFPEIFCHLYRHCTVPLDTESFNSCLKHHLIINICFVKKSAQSEHLSSNVHCLDWCVVYWDIFLNIEGNFSKRFLNFVILHDLFVNCVHLSLPV